MSISGKGRGNPSIYLSPAGSALGAEPPSNLPTSNSCKLAIILARPARAPQTQVISAQHGAFPEAGKARAPADSSEVVKPAKCILKRGELAFHHNLSAWTPGALQGKAQGEDLQCQGEFRNPTSLNYCFIHCANFLDCAAKSKLIMKTFFPL